MKKTKLVVQGIIQASGVLSYIFLLSVFMNKANDWIGEDDRGLIAPILVLLIFVFSALITGSLVLAKPIMFYIDGKKKDGIKLLFYTGASIFVFIFLIFLTLLFLNK
jgi:hypothetical protein